MVREDGGRMGGMLRRVTLGVLAALQPRRPRAEVTRWYDGLPAGRRRGVTAAVMAGLFAGSLFFGQWGWIGLVAWLALVVFVIG
jgi:hypothetical protein